MSLHNHGLIGVDNFDQDIKAGIYHTSLADLSVGSVINLAKNIDLIIMLDQPKKEWSHWKLLQTTYKVMLDLERAGFNTQFRSNENVKLFEKSIKMISEKPGWCIYPWINYVSRDEGGTRLCARSLTKISDDSSIEAWHSSPTRKSIQTRMLAGEKLPDTCAVCYDYEDRGIESYRQYESLDWLNQLDISSFDELEKITHPIYYEVHWGNKCNIKCRSCQPSRSSAIHNEFEKYQITVSFDKIPISYPSVDTVDIETLSRTSRVYVTGGEPAIMPETVIFLKKCLDAGKTDFELTMSTNGVKFPQEFLDLLRHFPHVNLSFSLDGYGKINDYWRSGSSWEKIVENMRLMQQSGHNISINTVPGIYNVTNLDLLLNWLDREFPMTAVYMQINHLGFQSAYNHPDRSAVIECMKRCQQTKIYWSDGKSCRSAIDSLLNFYENRYTFSLDDLRKFFLFNDRLDEIRRVKLADFIPELEAQRRLL